jgi:hypothetical protein
MDILVTRLTYLQRLHLLKYSPLFHLSLKSTDILCADWEREKASGYNGFNLRPYGLQNTLGQASADSSLTAATYGVASYPL